MDVSGGQIENVDLIERVVLFPLAFKDQLLAVGGEIPFSAPASFEDELSHICEESSLILIRFCLDLWGRETNAEREKEQSGEVQFHGEYLSRERFLTRTWATAQYVK